MAAALLVLGTWRSFLADATADALTLGNLVTVELLLEAAQAAAAAAAVGFLASGFPNSACMTFETVRLGENWRASVGFLWFPPDKGGSTFDMTNDPFTELLVCTLLLLGNCFLATPVLVKLTDGGKLGAWVTPLFDIVVFDLAAAVAEDDNIEDFVGVIDTDGLAD